MFFKLILSYPSWFIVFCFIAGFVYSWLLYRKDTAVLLSKFWKGCLASLRFLSVSLLVFLLLGPFVKILSRTIEKPLILIAQDNSSSLSIVHDSAFLENYKRSIAQLAGELEKKFDVKIFSFGSRLNEHPNFDFIDDKTDFGMLKDELVQRYVNLNVGALVIASDGIYNRGNNPLYLFRQSSYPVFTIAMGDTLEQKDLLISDVHYNRHATFGNRLTFEAILQATDADGALAELSVESDSGVVFSKKLTISGKYFTQKIPVSFLPSKKGINRYQLKLNQLEGEVTYQNNEKTIYIEVSDSKFKILLLATSAHPDVGAVRNVVESNPNYELSYYKASDFKENFKPYSLVIFHQCPSSPNELGLARQVLSEGIAAWFIIGTQTSVPLFNQLNTGVTIENMKPGYNESLASFNPGFSAFSIPEQLNRVVNTLPPLIAPFGTYKPTSALQVLFYQRIGNIITSQPLLAFNFSTSKTGILAGEGLWRWRLTEYNSEGNSGITNDIILKTIQYLLFNEKKNPLKIFYKKEYESAEPLLFDAELYNPSGELTTENDINMVITGGDKAQYEYLFSKTGNDRFSLNAGRLEPGRYQFKARSRSGASPVSYEGEFLISTTNVEALNTRADHQLLYQISMTTGGQMFDSDHLGLLATTLLESKDIKPVSYSDIKLRELIDLKWIFFLIITLLATEWFIRKRCGAY
ncbi:MAG: hypothetical protein LC117_04255 [Bacteroidia bacterium]|nr:hypothetical protein [Bacteroidia bacterium]MCZ2277121.1 hypothetical protein [Bacteroidia bacterium]